MEESKKQHKYTHKIRQKRLLRATYHLFDLFVSHRAFLAAIGGLVLIAFFIVDYPAYAAWYGFLIASYSVISNDSIQTLGVFITANTHRTRWWVMCAFISIVFVCTVSFSWWYYGGDVSYGRLQSHGLDRELTEVHFGQLITPIFLLLFTRLGMPISTSFLLLSTFTKEPLMVFKMVNKSLGSYIAAAVVAYISWSVLYHTQLNKRERRPGKQWFVAQWISSGLLWSVWLMQDGSNMAIFLSRYMDLPQFIFFVLLTCSLLFLLFYTNGGSMQYIVSSKTGITHIESAFFVNACYLLLLLGVMCWDNVPASTTWGFIGLLAGRELATSQWGPFRKKSKRERIKKSWKLVFRDLAYALGGLLFSLLLSSLVNADARLLYQEVFT